MLFVAYRFAHPCVNAGLLINDTILDRGEPTSAQDIADIKNEIDIAFRYAHNLNKPAYAEPATITLLFWRSL